MLDELGRQGENAGDEVLRRGSPHDLLLAGCSETEEPKSTTPAPAIPAIRVVDMAGLRAELDRLQGKPVLVNFWAMWCPPCVDELPDLHDIAKEFRENGGEVLAVSRDLLQGGDVDEIKARIPGFLQKRGVSLPVLVFDDPDPFALQRSLEVDGRLPETLAIDVHGNVAKKHLGRATRAQFEALAKAARR